MDSPLLFCKFIIWFQATVSFASSELKGTDFTELFEFPDNSIWTQANGSIMCTTHRLRSCAFMRSDNLHYLSLKDTPETKNLREHQRNLMAVWLLNDCADDECCEHSGTYENRCTTFSSGMLTSRKLYSYGLFLFLARAVPHRADQTDGPTVPARACFSLMSERTSEKHVDYEISMCFTSSNVKLVHIIWKHGEIKWSDTVHLGFDASMEIASYGFRLEPNRITFYCNSEPITQVESWEHPIHTSGDMKIKIYVLPLPSDIGFAQGTVEMALLMHRVAYRELRYKKPEHDELFFSF